MSQLQFKYYFIFLTYCYRTTVEFESGSELFNIVGQHVTSKGFTSIMPWMAVSEKKLPQFLREERIKITKVDIHEVLIRDTWLAVIEKVSRTFQFFHPS